MISKMQTVLLEPSADTGCPEEEIMGSRNHSYLQTVLAAELFNLDRFAVYTELSLDISGKEYKPDIALYQPEQCVDTFLNDVLRMTDMPLCAIEILSPRQFIESILDKFKVYFPAGVQSCWLVLLNTRTVLVYSDLETVHAFSSGEAVDEKLNLRLPLSRIFRQMSNTGQSQTQQA
ncbi:MAG: Uma2 family endonuclease [Gammaproteobacteria bacterium]|nr:Uma2 family endonuclease [Gammaproteobacteria bacterium]